MKSLFILLSALMIAIPVLAQDATPTAEEIVYPFVFPVSAPGNAQILEAVDCDLAAQGGDEPAQATRPPKPSACELALQALGMAAARPEDSVPSDEELALLTKVIASNSALPFDLELLRWYFGAMPLVAPPAFTENAVTELHITYNFAGLGGSAYYVIDITNADEEPVVTGRAEANNSFGESGATDQPPTPTAAQELSGTVDKEALQAFGPALRDLLPIGQQFTSTPCWDYYPDWVVTVTFADGTEVEMVTNDSNVLGIGGPWQTEIEGQNYMQYSGAFSGAIIDLFAALDLEFGQTAAMGCGGMSNPLEDAFPAVPIVN